MKALRFERFGDLTNLSFAELPDPIPAKGELVVEVRAASLNPSDVKNVLGKMEGTTLPRTPGRDFAGVVVDGPAELRGKEVLGTGGDIGFTRDGSHAERIVVPIDGVTLKPQALSMEQAATIGVNFVTAWLGIEALALSERDTLLVTGAGGGVGSAAMQIAKWRGARVVATDRTAEGAARARASGADLAFVPDGEGADQLIAKIRELNGGAGVTAAFDCVGGPLFEASLRSLEPDGRQVNITSVGNRRVSFDLLDFYHRRLTLRGVDSRHFDTVKCAAILKKLAPGFESGALRSSATLQRFPLADGREAYRQVNDGQVAGKAIFVIAALIATNHGKRLGRERLGGHF